MKKSLPISVLVILIFSFCKRDTPDFYTTEHGLKYKYHDINSEGDSPKLGDYMTVYMQWKTSTDSIFYDSKNVSQNGIETIKLGKQIHLGGIEEGFAKLQKGDSVSFYINPKRFYKDYLNQDEVPTFLKNETEIIITIRLLKIETQAIYESNLEKQKEELELEELKAISTLVKKWKLENDSVIEINGSYLVLEPTLDTNRLRYGNIIQLDYEASFLNGVVFYSTYTNGKPDEFQIGKDKQIIDGLKYALSKMRYNQKAKVLVPSFQGFGNQRTSGNIIPPYTPTIYKISVLPIK